MSIVRVKKRDKPYVVMDKTGLEDERLSFKAKGMLTYLLSKPDNWTARISHLKKVSQDGETAVKSGLKELEEYGYLEKKAIRNDDGTIKKWESIIYETPVNSPEVQNPHLDNPHEDNRPLISNDCNKQRNKQSKKKKRAARTREEQNSQEPPTVIADKFKQVFNRQLSPEFYEKMTKHFTDPKILLQALKIAEEKADKPAYLLEIMADWAENGLDSTEGIINYIEQRKAQKGTQTGSDGSNKLSEKAQELLDADKLMERDDWN